MEGEIKEAKDGESKEARNKKKSKEENKDVQIQKEYQIVNKTYDAWSLYWHVMDT